MTKEDAKAILSEYLWAECKDLPKFDPEQACKNVAIGKCPLRVKLAAETLLGLVHWPSDVREWLIATMKDEEQDIL
jgi:hypothetical protein